MGVDVIRILAKLHCDWVENGREREREKGDQNFCRIRSGLLAYEVVALAVAVAVAVAVVISITSLVANI